MEIILDQLLDLLDMQQLNIVRINALLNECIIKIQSDDVHQVRQWMTKKNVIMNRMRMIDETLQRGQIALLGFERLRPAVEKYYEANP